MDAKQMVVDLYNQTAEQFDQVGVAFFGPAGQRLVELAGLQPGQRVLDIGSGRGAALFPAVAAVGAEGEVIGIDLANEMVKHLNAEIGRQGLTNARVRLMDGEDPQFPPTSFDAIIGSFSIVLLPHAIDALPRYHSLLRPGGILAFSGPAVMHGGSLLIPKVLWSTFEEALDDANRKVYEQLEKNLWLAEEDGINQALEKAGYSSVVVHRQDAALVVRSGEEWVSWSKTTGLRFIHNQVPATERPKFEARLVGAVEAMRTGDGPIAVPIAVSYVIARA
ncbi:MAG: class I SAM-dependent methyltransferase [Candidatus Dormibacteraceae bacterium]